MATVTRRGNPLATDFILPTVGSIAPDFSLVALDLSEATLATFASKRKVLNIYPSVDTPICALSTKTFNSKVANMTNNVVLCIAKDTPFAFKRFIENENAHQIVALSAFRDQRFGADYGVLIDSGALTGFFCRAIVILDENNRVMHTELVSDIGNEPNYEAVVALLT